MSSLMLSSLVSVHSKISKLWSFSKLTFLELSYTFIKTDPKDKACKNDLKQKKEDSMRWRKRVLAMLKLTTLFKLWFYEFSILPRWSITCDIPLTYRDHAVVDSKSKFVLRNRFQVHKKGRGHIFRSQNELFIFVIDLKKKDVIFYNYMIIICGSLHVSIFVQYWQKQMT